MTLISRLKGGPSQRVALALAGAWAGLFVLHSLLARTQWERDDNVEICVDGPEIEMLTDQNDEETWRTLNALQEAGVSSVSVYWEPTRSLRRLVGEWAPRVPEGLGLTLRPEPVPFSDWANGWPRAARERGEGPPVVNVLFAGETVMGYPDLSMVTGWLAETAVHLPWVEFSRQKGMTSLLRAFPDRVVRAHTLTEEEMPRANPAAVIGRLRRAVRERGARFLYVRLFPGLSRAQNQAFVERLAADLRSDGWRLGPAVARFDRWPASLLPLPSVVRAVLAFVAAVFFPLKAYFWALRKRSVSRSSVGLMGAGLATGLLVAALLSAPSFAMGFTVFRGVKLALLLPLGIALFSLYRGDEIRHAWHENVTVGRLVVGFFLLGAVAYFVLRIGHGSVADASTLELAVRGKLETLLGVRPRFKEFAIGHPLLWLGFYLRARLGQGDRFLPLGRGILSQGLRFFFHDARPFLLAGFIGPLSVVNTFCHAHTPLWISLIRSFHGMWAGAAVGGLLIAGVKWAEGRWHRLP